MQMNEGKFVAKDEIAYKKGKEVVWTKVYFLLAKQVAIQLNLP